MSEKRDYDLHIVKGENGFYADWWEEIETGVFSRQVHVVEEGEDELEAMVKLLYFVKEHFGLFFSKHNKKNVVIEIK